MLFVPMTLPFLLYNVVYYRIQNAVVEFSMYHFWKPKVVDQKVEMIKRIEKWAVKKRNLSRMSFQCYWLWAPVLSKWLCHVH